MQPSLAARQRAMEAEFVSERSNRKDCQRWKNQPRTIQEQFHHQGGKRYERGSMKHLFRKRHSPRAFMKPTVVDRQAQIGNDTEKERPFLSGVKHCDWISL